MYREKLRGEGEGGCTVNIYDRMIVGKSKSREGSRGGGGLKGGG